MSASAWPASYARVMVFRMLATATFPPSAVPPNKPALNHGWPYVMSGRECWRDLQTIIQSEVEARPDSVATAEVPKCQSQLGVRHRPLRRTGGAAPPQDGPGPVHLGDDSGSDLCAPGRTLLLKILIGGLRARLSCASATKGKKRGEDRGAQEREPH